MSAAIQICAAIAFGFCFGALWMENRTLKRPHSPKKADKNERGMM